MMKKFEEDDRLDELNARKRREKQMEHRREIERLLEKRREAYEAARARPRGEGARGAPRRAAHADHRGGAPADDRQPREEPRPPAPPPRHPRERRRPRALQGERGVQARAISATCAQGLLREWVRTGSPQQSAERRAQRLSSRAFRRAQFVANFVHAVHIASCISLRSTLAETQSNDGSSDASFTTSTESLSRQPYMAPAGAHPGLIIAASPSAQRRRRTAKRAFVHHRLLAPARDGARAHRPALRPRGDVGCGRAVPSVWLIAAVLATSAIRTSTRARRSRPSLESELGKFARGRRRELRRRRSPPPRPQGAVLGQLGERRQSRAPRRRGRRRRGRRARKAARRGSRGGGRARPTAT